MKTIGRIAVLAPTVLSLTLLSAASALAEEEGHESLLLGNVRQLTFEGRRAGEGYFSADGSKLVFQSERDADNPFYQIFLMDLETGDTRRLSTGVGKTTCGWLHPDLTKALFASTHLDPDAKAKQQEELDKRAAGEGRRYSWSFDETYDIFETDLDGGGDLRNLTDTLGYDAEGSWSPDGTEILFASNRHAYGEPLSDADQAILEQDPSHFMDLYIMNADGSNVRRLTDTPGYDGGPFFSADGEKIIWRRFSSDGATTEIYTMNRDGSGEQAITRLGAMSWAPFFHPSGDYVIFATSVHGFGNFELYLVDSEGRGEPVRMTGTDGFDGLPVFSPDGQQLTWASSRTQDKKPQIFIADWNDAEARRLLGLDDAAAADGGEPEALPDLPKTHAGINPLDLRQHVERLASEEMAGRLTGSPGERLATAYVAAAFERLGLEPAGDDGYFQPFDFTAGVSLGTYNRLTIEGLDAATTLDQDWRPLGLSAEGDIGSAEVVFAGYGIVAPASEGEPAYDSFDGLDVADKWVMVLRYLPEDVTPERRQHLYRYADLGYKAAVARERGALGLIVVSGPQSGVDEELVPLGFDAVAAGSELGAVSISDALAASFLAAADRDLETLQKELDQGGPVEGFALPDMRLAVTIDLDQELRQGRNVLARLSAGSAADGMVLIGAHVDHLGSGVEGKSLARPEERGKIHPGADDNASGVAALIEIAEYLSDLKARGEFQPVRDLVFAAWSGEELGLLGSGHFAQTFNGKQADLGADIAAYLNLDMIGHYRDQLILQGVGSSSIWPREIERRNAPVGLSITTNDNAFLPTDATSFYLKGVPVLNAFTGAHADYSSPRDTAEGLNYEGAGKVTQLMALITRAVALADEPPDYIRQESSDRSHRRRTSRVYLGTIPDYTNTDTEGARIGGIAEGGPAQAAGLQGGDAVVEIAGRTIANVYDYSHALDGLKIGEPVELVVVREGERVTLTLTPAARD